MKLAISLILALALTACGKPKEKDKAAEQAGTQAGTPTGEEEPASKTFAGFPNKDEHHWEQVGDKVIDAVALKKGGAFVKASHEGDGNFIVELLDSSGETVELVVNEIGVKTAQRFFEIPDDGTYAIQVKANGLWKIDMLVPEVDDVAPSQWSGSGPLVTEAFPLEGGKPYKFIGKYEGTSNFIVTLADAVTGETEELVFNELKAYEGEKIVSLKTAKHCIIEIIGRGEASWSLRLEPQ